MKRFILGAAALFCGMAVHAAPPPYAAPVVVQNTPLPVSVSGTPTINIGNPVQVDGLVQVSGVVEPVFLAFVENNNGGGPNLETGLPGLSAGTTFHNTSDTTALIYFHVSVNHLDCSRTDVPVTLRIGITDTPGYLGENGENRSSPHLQVPFYKQNDAYFDAPGTCAWRAQLGPVFVAPDKYVVVQEFWSGELSSSVTQDFFITGYYMK